MARESDGVDVHYARGGDLTDKILGALADYGKELEALTVEDLAPVDQFHTRGHQASEELAALLEITAADEVLDVGCGIGGPARWLAAQFSCRVQGLDLTEAYISTARALTARLGLAASVEFTCADALDMPFAEARFDVVWTQHAAMNIPDKSRLYGELSRVLKAGGRLGLYDVVAGPKAPPEFPVPWAGKPDWSHLVPADDIYAAVTAAGLEALHWRDLSDDCRLWGRQTRETARKAAEAGERPPLSPRLFLGPDFPVMIGNYMKGLEEDRVRVIQAVFRKTAVT
jgi:SAM-dependent methyltransferase